VPPLFLLVPSLSYLYYVPLSILLVTPSLFSCSARPFSLLLCVLPPPLAICPLPTTFVFPFLLPLCSLTPSFVSPFLLPLCPPSSFLCVSLPPSFVPPFLLPLCLPYSFLCVSLPPSFVSPFLLPLCLPSSFLCASLPPSFLPPSFVSPFLFSLCPFPLVQYSRVSLSISFFLGTYFLRFFPSPSAFAFPSRPLYLWSFLPLFLMDPPPLPRCSCYCHYALLRSSMPTFFYRK
jgi:hypothetical protein